MTEWNSTATLEGKKQMGAGLFERLRFAFRRGAAEATTGCCVPGCDREPTVVVAATHNDTVSACGEHASVLLASDEWRLGVTRDGMLDLGALRRWAASQRLPAVRTDLEAPVRPVRLARRQASTG